jgi:diadenylate cyclase
MEQLVQIALATLARLDVWSVLDIIIVAAIIYGVLSLFRGTTALTVLYGIVFLMAAVIVVGALPQLAVLNWLLRNALPFLTLALLIMFQPELRRAMERIGRVRELLYPAIGYQGAQGLPRTIEEVAKACRWLSERRYGALIVLERNTGLQEYAESGVLIDGLVSMECLLTVFFPNSPLHDGAVIIRGDRIAAAGCLLPLSGNTADYQLGTRHRAALGVTEATDAISVVVSEETGVISLANNGRLVRNLDENKVKRVLSILLRSPGYENLFPWPRRPGESGGRGATRTESGGKAPQKP